MVKNSLIAEENGIKRFEIKLKFIGKISFIWTFLRKTWNWLEKFEFLVNSVRAMFTLFCEI